MPSFIDTLETLSHHSQNIQDLCAHNDTPIGPFTQAYLHKSTIGGLIRDAQESEARLFKRIGEVTSNGGGGGVVKRVEKREGEMTPLKNLNIGGGQGGKGRGIGGNGGKEVEVGKVLTVALKLVDDFRPMPRARAHIVQLMENHQKQMDRIEELERLIAEANRSPVISKTPPPASVNQALSESSSSTSKPALTAEEAIKAEESSLRALEASLSKLRTTQPDRPLSLSQSGSKSTSTNPSPVKPDTPQKAQTPASKKSIANAFSHPTNTALTPARSRPTFDRFSPLKYLNTPRAPVALVPSGLRRSVLGNSQASNGAGAEAGEGDEDAAGIFGGKPLQRSLGSKSNSRTAGAVQNQDQAVPSVTSPADEVPEELHQGEGGEQQGELEEDEEEEDVPVGGNPDGDETMRYVPHQLVLSGEEEEGQAPEETIPATAEPEENVKTIGGVQLDSPGVQAAADKLYTTLGDLMRQGLSEGQTVEQTPESVVKHIYNLSQSSLPPPPSPSTASSLSSLTSGSSPAIPKAPPITTQTILMAHLYMLILKGYGESASATEGSVPMNEAKEYLKKVVQERGWEGSDDLGTKTIYAGVAKKVLKLDRKGGGMGRIRFA